MKNGEKFERFKKGKPMIIISGSVLVGTILFTGCSEMVKNGGSTDISSSDNINTSTSFSEIVSSETIIDETTQNTKPSVTYSFIWDYNTTEKFNKYVEKELGVSLGTYIRYYGFGGPLNRVYTDYLKENYGVDKSEESVPFSSSNYFYMYMVDQGRKGRYRDYEFFKARFLQETICTNDAFRNKLVISYLIQNNIPLGSRIPTENFEYIDSDFIKIGNQYGLDFFDRNENFGNYDKQHIYSSGDIIAAGQIYNDALAYIFYTEGLKEQDIFKDPELCDILNQHLKTFYGENAIQIGQVPTREQYKAIFGEDPLDLSYIPGAVVNDSQVKGNAQVRYGV